MKKNNQKTLFSAPGGKSYLVPFILITSLFLLWGFAHGLLDVLNKHFQGVYDDEGGERPCAVLHLYRLFPDGAPCRYVHEAVRV